MSWLFRCRWGALLCWPALAGTPPIARAQDAVPDFDLRVACPRYAMGKPGEIVVLEAAVMLTTTPLGAEQAAGARAWSLSVSAVGVAALTGATTAGTLADLEPLGRRRGDGYERTEITTGPQNEGFVSAVLLSLSSDVTLPAEGEATLLKMTLEVAVPVAGAHEIRLDLVDGLRGTGQPVRNVIAVGEGISRRDDGVPGDDHDADGPEGCACLVNATPPFVRGDASGDGLVSLTDSVRILDFLFRGVTPPPCMRAADGNDDAEVSLTDVLYLLGHLFRGSAAPPAPFPACGADSTPDNLRCADSPACLRA